MPRLNFSSWLLLNTTNCQIQFLQMGECCGAWDTCAVLCRVQAFLHGSCSIQPIDRFNSCRWGSVVGLEIQAQFNAKSKLFSIAHAQYSKLTESILADGRVLWGWRYMRRLMPHPSFSLILLLNTTSWQIQFLQMGECCGAWDSCADQCRVQAFLQRTNWIQSTG